MEAITTLRCCETFSLEQLELLGDSVLKYVIGCDLFLRYPKKHEGHLSDMRSTAVCNATLHRHGIRRSLQVDAFKPKPRLISYLSFSCFNFNAYLFLAFRVMYVIVHLTHVVGLPLDRYHCALFLVPAESRLHLFLLVEDISESIHLLLWENHVTEVTDGCARKQYLIVLKR